MSGMEGRCLEERAVGKCHRQPEEGKDLQDVTVEMQSGQSKNNRIKEDISYFEPCW